MPREIVSSQGLWVLSDLSCLPIHKQGASQGPPHVHTPTPTHTLLSMYIQIHTQKQISKTKIKTTTIHGGGGGERVSGLKVVQSS